MNSANSKVFEENSHHFNTSMDYHRLLLSFNTFSLKNATFSALVQYR